MTDNACCIEPTFTLNGTPILQNSMPSLPAFADAVEGSECAAVTHLALLGVKIQETAFWVKKQP